MRRVTGLLAGLLVLWSGDVWAATLLETASLGPVGQVGGGAVISSASWFGAVFTLDSDSDVVFVGAHLRATAPGEVFAAILPVDPMTGEPECLDLSCAEATGLVVPPDPSGEVVVPLTVTLDAGDYAVVFGSGAAGATGQAVAPLNNPMIGMPTFMGRVLFNGQFVWVPQTGQIDARFFVGVATCGDGEVDAGEQCDDGNADQTDACLTTCVGASCGDGFVQSGVETCDPGDLRGPACTDDCELEQASTSSGTDSGDSGDSGDSTGTTDSGDTTDAGGSTDSGDTTDSGDATDSGDTTETTDSGAADETTAGPDGQESSTTSTATSASASTGTPAEPPDATSDSTDGGPNASGNAEDAGCGCASPERPPSLLLGLSIIALALRRGPRARRSEEVDRAKWGRAR